MRYKMSQGKKLSPTKLGLPKQADGVEEEMAEEMEGADVQPEPVPPAAPPQAPLRPPPPPPPRPTTLLNKLVSPPLAAMAEHETASVKLAASGQQPNPLLKTPHKLSAFAGKTGSANKVEPPPGRPPEPDASDMTFAPSNPLKIKSPSAIGFAGKGKISAVRPAPLGSSQKISLDDVSEQTQSYLEVCDSLASKSWTAQDLIDLLNLMVLSLDLDCVTFILVDRSETGKFSVPFSRGYRVPPRPAVVTEWESAIGGKNGIDWEKLMASASDNQSKLAQWIMEENIQSFGYVPVCDFDRIYGFIFFGSYKSIDISPIAANLLELCGGRIGMSLSIRDSGSGNWPEKALAAIKELRDSFSLIMGYIELASEDGDMPAEGKAALLRKCGSTLAASVQLLDRLTQEATS